MKPYYEQDGITIYHADCKELPVESMKANSIITDPPYSVDKNGAMLGFLSPDWDRAVTHSRGYADHDRERYFRLMFGAWSLLLGAVHPGGLLVSFGGNRTFHEMSYWASEAEWEIIDVLVFQRSVGVAKSPTTLRPAHELAMLARRPGPKRNINPHWTKSNLYSVGRGEVSAEHPTAKSLSWMTVLVEDFTEPGETVLDPFTGSGTTLVAAKRLGRKAIGVEIDERYCEIAAKRLAQGSFDFTVSGAAEEGE